MKEFKFKPALNAEKNQTLAEKNRLESYAHRAEMNSLKRVYSLPPDYRYSAAKDFGLLKWYEHQHNGLSYRRGSIWENDELVKNFVEEFQTIAYQETDFGRKKNIHRGSRTLYFPANFSTESIQKGKWTSYDYYADFSVFFNRKTPEVIFSYNNKTFKINVIETPMKLMKYKHVAESEPFKGSNLRWDAKQIAFVLENETYHIYENEVYQTAEGAQKLFNRINRALTQRIGEKMQFLKDISDDLVISVQHSVAAGNCQIGTEQFRKRYGLTEKEAYTVKELKEKGVDFSNQFFKRALNEAMK